MKKKLILEKEIEYLELNQKITNILKSNEVYYIKDLWVLNRQDLKKMNLIDSEISQVTIKLQLSGIDLNGKIY